MCFRTSFSSGLFRRSAAHKTSSPAHTRVQKWTIVTLVCVRKRRRWWCVQRAKENEFRQFELITIITNRRLRARKNGLMLDYAHERVLQPHSACPDRQNNTKGVKPVINIPSWANQPEQKMNTGQNTYINCAADSVGWSEKQIFARKLAIRSSKIVWLCDGHNGLKSFGFLKKTKKLTQITFNRS